VAGQQKTGAVIRPGAFLEDAHLYMSCVSHVNGNIPTFCWRNRAEVPVAKTTATSAENRTAQVSRRWLGLPD
jgi:hypothetical protein